MCSNWYLFADIWYYIHVHKKSKSFCLFLFFLLAAHEHEALENSDMSRKRHQGPTTVVDVLYIPVKYEQLVFRCMSYAHELRYTWNYQ